MGFFSGDSIFWCVRGWIRHNVLAHVHVLLLHLFFESLMIHDTLYV